MTAMPGGGRRRFAGAVGLINLGRAASLALVAAVVVAAPARAQAPDEDWRTIPTEHFRINYPERLEPLARRAADRAEWAYAALREALIEPPRGTIDVVVTDHTDTSNGYATVVPSDRIVVFARPPVDSPSLGYFDDWIELVLLHELAHVVHLDHTANPLGRLARSVFGRAESGWPFFPSTDTPRWVIEGLATWYESRLTGAGRVHGTFQETQVRTAFLEGRFEDIGQASGESPLWPGGNRAYAYGAQFFDYLLDKHGEERMAAFVEAIAGQWIPYRMDAAGREAFGASLSDEWDAWRDSLADEYGDLDARLLRLGPITESERLTTDARWGWHPRVSPDGRRLVYVRSDGRSDLQLRLDDPAGGAARPLTRTNGLATFDWLPDGRILFSQLELEGPYRSYGDLYVTDLDGHAERLTVAARLSDPSVAPGGSWAVAVQQGDGTNGLVRVELPSGAIAPLVPPDPDVHWAFPRLSPDGRWIAATRWEHDALADIVVLDAATGAIVDRVTRDRAVDVAPAWGPAGSWLVWASDRSGIQNILGARVDAATGRTGEARLLTNVRTGATFPSIDPSGAWLYYSGYHVDGWDVERTPLLGDAAPPAPPVAARFAPTTPPTRGSADAPSRPYSAGPTLRPSYWEFSYREPIAFAARTTTDGYFLRRREGLGYALGLQTSGRDLVGRHSFSAFGRVFLARARVEGGMGYAFSGLGNPVFGVSATQRYDAAGQVAAGATPDTLFILQAERELLGSVTLLAPTWRHDLSVTLGAGLVWESRDLLDTNMDRTSAYALTRPTSRLSQLTASGSFVTSRTHSFQMGIARGFSLFVQGRLRNELALPDSLVSVEGVDRSLGDVVGRVRAAVPLWTTGRVTHVVAIEAAGGVAGGPGAGAGHFDVGGASGQPEAVTGAELFGGEFIFFPLRGYPTAARFGRYAWAATAEYRFPIALINRGVGAWPLHFDRVVGSLFVDAGNAWGPDVSASGFRNPLGSALTSVGAEVTTELLVLFDVVTRVRVGVAAPLVESPGASVYVRVGLPF